MILLNRSDIHDMIKILMKGQSLESNQTKMKNENCRPNFIESVHERK